MATKKSQTEFQTPGSEDGQLNMSSDQSGYEVPDEDGAMEVEAVESETEAFLSSVDSQIMAVKSELEKLLGSLGDEADGMQSQAAMDANITGVGIGLGDGQSVAGVSALADSDFPIKAVHTGVIDAQPHRMRLRPAPGGISCGHFAITAGTLGCLVRGRSAPRINRLMVLSNNHVLANTNAGPLGASILQPGPFDGGNNPADRIAILERFVPINFAAGAANVVDCATGWAWPDRVRKELMYISGGVIRYFRVGAVPVAAFPGMQVGKTGRTTQLTRGGVTAVGVTLNVNFGGGRVARFVNQIAVRTPGGNFSAGGDSGSLIWTWDARRAPVALLFAGGGGTTFGNPIASVLARLDVQLVT